MRWDETVWKQSAKHFGGYMEPLVKDLGRIERREGAALYVAGLLTPGQRKSVEPMAQRLGVDYQKLQQFISDSPWDEERVWEAIAQEVIPMLGPVDSWMIDETGWIKQGDKSVGVAHQYCGAVGKRANAQVSVHLAVGIGKIAAPVAAQLFLPKQWCEDEARRRRVRVPQSISYATKPQIALELIKMAKVRGVPTAPVLGDCLYGHSGPLREGLRKLEFEYLLQIEPQLVGWTHAPVLRKARKNWRPQHHEVASRDVAQMAREIPDKQWVNCRWRAANGRMQKTRLAWIKVWLWSDLDEIAGEIPPTWLVVDWPQGHESLTISTPDGLMAHRIQSVYSNSVVRGGPLSNTSSAIRTILASITLRAAHGRDFTTISPLPLRPTFLFCSFSSTQKKLHRSLGSASFTRSGLGSFDGAVSVPSVELALTHLIHH